MEGNEIKLLIVLKYNFGVTKAISTISRRIVQGICEAQTCSTRKLDYCHGPPSDSISRIWQQKLNTVEMVL